MFSKNELYFPNQSNFSSGLSQILIPHPSIPISSLAPLLSLSSFAPENWNLSSTIIFMILFVFSISSYPNQPHTTSIEYTKLYAKTSQSNLLSSYTQIIKPYMGQTHIHQKFQSLRAVSVSLSKLDNMLNSNSDFIPKCAELYAKW